MSVLVTFFDLVKSGGLSVLFLLIFLEANPLIGSFIPGQVIVVFVGFLISSKSFFNIYYTLIVVFWAALLGDIFGYYLGKKLGINGLKKFGMSENNKLFQSSYRFFKRYGPWSIIMGREFNLTRAFMPFLAGSFGMKTGKFLFFSVLSCFIWTLVSVGLGYYFGFVIINNFNFIMEFMLFFVIYIFLIFFAYKNFKVFYADNKFIFKKFAMHNLISIGFLISIFVILLFVAKWDFIIVFNEYFSILYFVSLYYFNFLFTQLTLSIIFLSLLFGFLYKREYKLAIVYIWSFILLFFLTAIIMIFLKIRFDFLPYLSIILYVAFSFYAWLLLKIYIKKIPLYHLLNKILIFILIFILLVKFSVSTNFYLVFLSFIIGVFGTEFILILSHYGVLDPVVSNRRFTPIRGHWTTFKEDIEEEKINSQTEQNLFQRHLTRIKNLKLSKRQRLRQKNNKFEDNKIDERELTNSNSGSDTNFKTDNNININDTTIISKNDDSRNNGGNSENTINGSENKSNK